MATSNADITVPRLALFTRRLIVAARRLPATADDPRPGQPATQRCHCTKERPTWPGGRLHLGSIRRPRAPVLSRDYSEMLASISSSKCWREGNVSFRRMFATWLDAVRTETNSAS